jgi:hypothetical protein
VEEIQDKFKEEIWVHNMKDNANLVTNLPTYMLIASTWFSVALTIKTNEQAR